MSMKMDDIHQTQFIEYIQTKMGKENWVTVFKVNNTIAQFSALIAKERTADALKKSDWDLLIGNGKPGLICKRIDGGMVCAYEAVNANEIEPLIIARDFHGMKENYEEVSEDFRLFHNLWHDKEKGSYYAILYNGDEEEVVKYNKLDREIKIKISYLHKYISVKQKNLALFFDRKVLGNHLAHSNFVQNEEMCYDFTAGQNIFPQEKYPYFSLLVGKKMIFCSSNSSEISLNKEYEKFIISQDEKGEAILHECAPNKLANYFGANPGCPNYVTPVFFKRDVLTKYYNDSERYTVEDNYIRCGGLWGIRIDNNHEKYIIVCLGDLGLYLPDLNEQKYWRSFNVVPDGKWSEVYWNRCFEVRFTGPSSPDLLFKQRFENLSQRWKNKKGWYLFLPFSPEDQYCFTSLHIPCDNNHKDFDQEISHLCKILVDSINQKELEAEIQTSSRWLSLCEKEQKQGIKKLEVYLLNNFPDDFSQHIEILRKLQQIRSSSSAHRKGEKYKKIIPEIHEKGLEGYFCFLLTEFVIFFDKLVEKFEL